MKPIYYLATVCIMPAVALALAWSYLEMRVMFWRWQLARQERRNARLRRELTAIQTELAEKMRANSDARAYLREASKNHRLN